MTDTPWVLSIVHILGYLAVLSVALFTAAAVLMWVAVCRPGSWCDRLWAALMPTAWNTEEDDA